MGTTARDESSDRGDGGSTTGTTEETGGTGSPVEVELELEPVYGVANLDDDDEDGMRDWYQYVFDGDDDVAPLTVPGLPEGHTIALSLSGDREAIRLWHEDDFAIGITNDVDVDAYEFVPGPGGSVLEVEFRDYNAAGTLSVTVFDAQGVTVDALELPLRAAPLIMNHHLQPTEHVWVVDVGNAWGGNAAMLAEFQQTLGPRFTAVPGSSYDYDVWIQDEVEFATSTGNRDERLDTVIDSVRDRGLDPFPEDMIVRPDFITRTWGNPNWSTTWDAFGNLEASPPVVVDGVEYPFGRIYYGRQGNYGLQLGLADVLATQRVQDPFELDTLWLCVGHVDEFSTFVPDPSAAKGFKLLLADTTAAYELLEQLDPTMALPRYGADHPPYSTVGAIVADPGLRALNEDLQAFELDPIREVFKTELGLTEDDIIEVPSLFEEISNCDGVAALIPGMVNLAVANPADDATHLFVPDPFFRGHDDPPMSDPVIQEFAARMPAGLELHFVDNWNVYHLGLGEVHCGTNVQRSPIAQWFETAWHLLENDG